eukprot:6872146-Pyramimonas_sp.AAC.1
MGELKSSVIRWLNKILTVNSTVSSMSSSKNDHFLFEQTVPIGCVAEADGAVTFSLGLSQCPEGYMGP